MVEVHNQGFRIPQMKRRHGVRRMEKDFTGKAVEMAGVCISNWNVNNERDLDIKA